MDPLFPSIPSDLSTLTDEEVAQLHTDSLAAVERIKSNDTEFLGDRTANQILDEMQAGVESIERLHAEQTAREEAAANFTSQVDELAGRVLPIADAEEAVVEAEVDAEAEPEAEAEVVAEEVVEPEAVEEPLPVAASGRLAVRRPLPPASRQHAPLPEKSGRATIVAAAGIQGVGEGAELDRVTLAEAIIAKRERSVSTPNGVQEDVVVASVKYTFPDDRILRRDDILGNERKIKAVTGEEALVASGGLCAPVTPIYDVPVIAVDDRPVRDALPSFQAVRGGVTVPTPFAVGDITGVGKITAAQDHSGGSAATKACQRVICEAYNETDVNAIYHCVEFGNLGSRAWPEQVAAFNENVMAAHARLAETSLLDAIASGSTHVTGAAVNGAVNTLVGHILEAAAGIRSYYRMRDGATLRALFPAWVKDLLVLDIVRSQFERFAYERDGIQQLLAMFDIQASFFLDGETGQSQVFGAQAAAALAAFPTTLLWYLFPEGTWLHLDAGVLELGIVRDSTLNSTNDYQIFGETWENVAKVGNVSYRIASTICPNGAVAAPGTALTC